MDNEPWKDWVGRREIARDLIGAAPARALAATLNRSADFPTDRLGCAGLFDWLYLLTFAPMAEIGLPATTRANANPRATWRSSALRLRGGDFERAHAR